MAVFTNGGLSLLATALQANGTSSAISYVSVGLGAGTLATALVNGSPYTSLSLQVALAVNIGAGQSLTLFDGVGDTQVITASGAGNIIGATSITVTCFNANANYAIGSGVVNTPAATDIQLQNEVVRLPAIPGFPGANPGESLNGSYFMPAIATSVLSGGGLLGRPIGNGNARDRHPDRAR